MNRVVNHSENIPFKYHDQKFCIKISFSRHHWTGLYIKKCLKKYVFGVFNSKNINLRSESPKKPIIYDFLFLISISFHTNDKKHCSEIRNYHQNGHFTRTIIVLGLGITLKTGLKC